MRMMYRGAWAFLLMLLVGTAIAASFGIGSAQREVPVNVKLLSEDITKVPGQATKVHGIDLLGQHALHWIGDPPDAAEHNANDTSWVRLRTSQDSVPVNGSVHWVRTWLAPAADLKDRPLVLNVGGKGVVTVYLNGRPVLGPIDLSARLHDARVPPASIPLGLLVDGPPEVVALRIEGAPGTSFRALEATLSLHDADTHYTVQQDMVHYGIFIGINLIIVLLALVIGRADRGRDGWGLLALLSFLAALEIITDLGGDHAALGWSVNVRRAMGVLNTLLIPWSPFVLLMVLAAMGVPLSPRRKRAYVLAAFTLSVIILLALVGIATDLVDVRDGFAFDGDQAWAVVLGIVLLVVFAVIVVWFSIDVVRFGIRLLRTPGNARWIGAGAVASSLLALVLNSVGASTGIGINSWLGLLAEYCTYVAVPVSIAVYMAIRSAEHNRLVARQRDELDLEVQERTAELRTEKERSDALLLNILPAEVAEELKQQGSAEARHFDHASVLFTDFKGFTTMAASVDPTELLQELNTCFKAFDGIIERHGVEKIKTIGDSYMCAAGLPDPGRSSAVDVVHAALEMQRFMAQRRAERTALGHPSFEMRVGIHTGPVVAGIVGVKKFQYDIWGDTVNTASRMESHSEVGEVNISRDTFEQVKGTPGLRFTPRGFLEVKGKGAMEMFFVEVPHGPRSEPG